MNANIKKMYIVYKMNYDLKGHIRSNKAFYVFLFSSNKFCAHFSAQFQLKGRGAVPYLLFGCGDAN